MEPESSRKKRLGKSLNIILAHGKRSFMTAPNGPTHAVARVLANNYNVIRIELIGCQFSFLAAQEASGPLLVRPTFPAFGVPSFRPRSLPAAAMSNVWR